MNIDIKSVLIGVLLTINIMMLMGFQWGKSSEEEGKYKFMVSNNVGIGNSDTVIYIGNSETGKVTSSKVVTFSKYHYKP